MVLLYVLVPTGLFRIINSFAFPIKLPKTKSQEITIATVLCLLPFLLATISVWTLATWPFPTKEDFFHRRLAYRTVFASLMSDKQLDNAVAADRFWASTNSVLRRQLRFLLWYYVFVAIEARTFSWLAASYQSKGKRWRDQIGRLAMRASLSEWAVLLTDLGSPKTNIEIDVLSTDGVLYQGSLRDYFFNGEGELAGVLLSRAARYDRDQYSAHQKIDLDSIVARWPEDPARRLVRDTTSYWKRIPGADLFYIPRERISNINVRHVPSPAEIGKATEERLASRKITGFAITAQPGQVTAVVGEVKASGS